MKQLEVELLSAEEKTWIARHVVDGTATASDLGKRYGLNRKTISRWASRLRAGHIIEEGVGRPSSLDTLSLGKVVQASQINNVQNRAMSRKQFDELVIREAEATQQRKNRAFTNPPCARTIKTIRMGIRCKSTKKASTTTEARTREEADPRNMLVEAVMLQAFQTGLPRSHVINLDATQYDVGQGSKNAEVVYIRGQGFDGPVVRVKTDDDKLGFYIKAYIQVSMVGKIGPLVFLLADDSMKPEEFRYFSIQGLTAGLARAGYTFVSAKREVETPASTTGSSDTRWLNLFRR